MTFLPEMCLGPKDILHFGDDPDLESGLLSGSLGGGLHFCKVLDITNHENGMFYCQFSPIYPPPPLSSKRAVTYFT